MRKHRRLALGARRKFNRFFSQVASPPTYFRFSMMFYWYATHGLKVILVYSIKYLAKNVKCKY